MNTLILQELLQHNPRQNNSSTIDMGCVASVILGGGEGTRLHPLTLTRCKPAINFGGKYKLIDIPISNSIHSNCCKIFVLTQFLSSSLHKHIFQTYTHNNVEILTAEQKPSDQSWYQGTADAVRQNLDYLLETPADYFLILSGDQLYNIDFKEMVQFAKDSDADVVVAALPVNGKDATRMGILKIDSDQFITDFYEKPQTREILDKFLHNKQYLGSMGIYVFKRQALIDHILQDEREDFGKHIIPNAVLSGKAAAYLYNDYWEDIGTIETFYQANLALTSPKSPFNLHIEKRPIFSNHLHLPPTQISHTEMHQTLICEGSYVEAREITNSLLGPRSIVHQGCTISDSYLMGNDYYTSIVKDHTRLPSSPHIGENCIINRCIIDKNVSIGKNVRLTNEQKLIHYNGDHVFIRDGIIIVPRGATIPNGFAI